MAKLQDLSKQQRNLLFLGATIALCCVLALAAEAAVRVRQSLQSGSIGKIEDIYTVDPASGLRVPVAGLEQGGIQINSLGFRGPELESPKPTGTLRLAFLGASTTFCADVSSNAATWPDIVVEQLRARYPDARFDYINAAVPGYSVSASERALIERVAQHQPDVVIVYHATNDLSGNSETLASAAGLVEARGDRALSWPSKYSTLWYLVEKNLRIMVRQRQAGDNSAKLEIERAALSMPFRDDLASLMQASAEVAKLSVLATFSHQQRADQAPKRQADAAVTSLYYMPYMSLEGLLEGFSAYNEVIRETADASGAVLIADEDAVPGDSVHFRDSVHFTDAGSKAMAARVFAALAGSARFSALLPSHSR